MAAVDPPSPSSPTVAPAAAGKRDKPPGQLRKLPGRPPTFRLRGFGQVQLYLTDAFLLQIDVIALREVYSKFAYKDIQVIEIMRTMRGAVWNWILGGIIVFCGLWLSFASREDAGPYVAAGLLVFFVIVLLSNVWRGPTCRTTVRTATGQHTLRSLVRLRPARKALGLISERIDAVQGSLDQPAAEREMENFLARRATPAPPSPA